MNGIPKHVAIIMDGNGRWARSRLLPRYVGHREGVKAVRRVVEACRDKGVQALTLFAFSSENWRRPSTEVGLLMELFIRTLRKEVDNLHRNGIRMRFIGDCSAFPEDLRKLIGEAEARTADNRRMDLVIAANYGGHWDITEACRTVAGRVLSGELTPEEITPGTIAEEICISDLPEPDLFIRTGGEKRISNFLLWQLAYTEFYFCDCLWPDFDEREMQLAIDEFQRRQRRFGKTGEQLEVTPEC